MIRKYKDLSMEVKAEVKKEVELIEEKLFLNVVQVGEDIASSSYIKSKERACEETGIEFNHIKVPSCITKSLFRDFMNTLIMELDSSNDSNAILVQLPLPSHLDENEVCNMIPSHMDADGFNPKNIGLMMIGEEAPLPCTPAGIIDIIKDKYNTIEGKEVLIINRSNIVGKPLVPLLLRENATVQIAHSRTVNLLEKMRMADIVITAVGKEKFIGKDMLSEMDKGNTGFIIDVSIMRGSNGKLCGDVDKSCYDSDYGFDIVSVPSGVGLMTVAELMKNVVACHRLQVKK